MCGCGQVPVGNWEHEIQLVPAMVVAGYGTSQGATTERSLFLPGEAEE